MRWKKLTMRPAVGIAAGVVAAAGLFGPRWLTVKAAPTPPPGPKRVVAHTVTRDHPVTEVAVRERLVAFADEPGNVLLWEVGAKEPRTVLKAGDQKDPPGPVGHLHFTPDQRFLYILPKKGGTWRHDFENGRTDGKGGGGNFVGVGLTADGRTSIGPFGPQGARRVVILTNDFEDWAEPEVIRRGAAVTHAVLTPDDQRAAVISDDGKISLFDRIPDQPPPKEPKFALVIEVKDLRAKAVRFSPDGKVLAVAGENGFARLYDATTGKEAAVLKGPKGIVFDVAFSPDGRTVATGADDNLARLWDAKTGEPVAVLEGHKDSVLRVAFGPGGTLVTGSADKTLKVWELKK